MVVAILVVWQEWRRICIVGRHGSFDMCSSTIYIPQVEILIPEEATQESHPMKPDSTANDSGIGRGMKSEEESATEEEEDEEGQDAVCHEDEDEEEEEETDKSFQKKAKVLEDFDIRAFVLMEEDRQGNDVIEVRSNCMDVGKQQM